MDGIIERVDPRETRRLRAKFDENFIEELSEELPEKPHNEPQAPKNLEAPDELQTPIEPPMETPTLFPAESTTKPAPQHPMELTPPTLPPLAPEPSIPKMACFGVHNKHCVIERIGLRSPLASCSAFFHLGHLHPAAALPFSSWAFTLFACAGQWELSEHG